MSVAVIGEGVAGLLTANVLAEDGHQVILVGSGASNSSIAGQRYRTGADSSPNNPSDMFDAIVANAPSEVDRSRVSNLVEGAIEGVALMRELGVPSVENDVWFGPQLGVDGSASKKQPGINVITILRNMAGAHTNIQTIRGRVQTIEKGSRQDRVGTVLSGSEQYEFCVNHLVLATGTPTGIVFESTNRSIRGSALAMVLGGAVEVDPDRFSVQGVEDIMVHPFGKISPKGKLIGCFATDPIANTPIFVDGERDEVVETALNSHTAHSQFPELSKRLFGKECRLRSAKDGPLFAPAVHYWHAGIVPKSDVVRIEDGLYVAGDTGNTSRYFPGQRLPGTALSMCLADAVNIRAQLKGVDVSGKATFSHIGSLGGTQVRNGEDDNNNERLLRSLNTQRALGLLSVSDHRQVVELLLGDNCEVSRLSCLYSGERDTIDV